MIILNSTLGKIKMVPTPVCVSKHRYIERKIAYEISYIRIENQPKKDWYQWVLEKNLLRSKS